MMNNCMFRNDSKDEDSDGGDSGFITSYSVENTQSKQQFLNNIYKTAQLSFQVVGDGGAVYPDYTWVLSLFSPTCIPCFSLSCMFEFQTLSLLIRLLSTIF